MSGEILFFDVHNPEYLPLIRSVADRGVSLIMSTSPLSRQLLEARVSVRVWESFIPADAQARLHREISRIANGLPRALEDPAVQQAFSSPLGQFLPRTGERFFQRLVSLLASEIMTLEILENVFQQSDLRLIVLGYDNNHAQRAIVRYAAQHGVPTLQLAHAMYGKLIHFRYAANMYTLYADYVAVFGERARRDMIALGTDPERILVTGAPHWDHLYAPEARIGAEEARQRLGLDPHRPVVLLCMGYADGSSAFFPAIMKRLLAAQQATIQAVRHLGEDVQLVVRPHPGELGRGTLSPGEREGLLQAYGDWVGRHGVRLALLSRDQKIEAIRAADVVIAMGSSSIIPEVMILQRPVVMLPWFDRDDHTFTERDGVVIVNEDQQLTQVLSELLGDPDRRKAMVERQNAALPDLNYRNDGKATERTAEAIMKLATASERAARQRSSQHVQTTSSRREPPRVVSGETRDASPDRDASRKDGRAPRDGRGSPRVLFAYRADIDAQGGAAVVMRETARALQDLGVHVDIAYDLCPSVRGYDLVHVFNIWEPHSALEQLRYLTRTGIPVVWSPIYLHWCEYAWANLAVRAAFDPRRTPEKREQLLQAFVRGTLSVQGMHRWLPNEVYPGFHQHLKEMLSHVDHVCVTSHREVQMLFQITRCVAKPFTVTPHGVDPSFLVDASPEPFQDRFGVRDFVLCVGAIDGRKNQLLLVEALKDTGLKLVLVGPSFESDYLDLCLREGGDQVLYTDRLPQDLVASAYKAARVHALPSFAEGAALANLEAAVAGCAMVVSNRSSEFEYFGDAPYYCDPVDPASIREAVLRAHESYAAERERWETLSRQVQERFTWERTAALTLEAYERTLSQRDSSREKRSRKTFHISRSYRPTIKWGAIIFHFSGYSRLSRETILALDRRGAMVAVEPLGVDRRFVEQLKADPDVAYTWTRLLAQKVEDEGVYICLHPPVLWNGTDLFAAVRQRNPGFKAYVGITMFETDRLPAGWADACNGMDEVWVPSTFNRDTFARAGVDPERIQVIPFGIDIQRYDPEQVQPREIPGRRGFTFLSVFQWSKRKGWDVLLRAYLSAFTPEDDVCLVLRTYPGREEFPPIRERIDRYIRELGYDPEHVPPIRLLEDFIPEVDMPALYKAADAFVLPSRGEGWGIPFMEAMAMGLPVIATRWSAHLDFMNDDNSYLIDIEGLVPVDPEQTAEDQFYTSDQRWAEPSVEHTAALMRHVYEHRDEARAKGMRARRDIQTKWTSDRTADWVIRRVAHLTGREGDLEMLEAQAHVGDGEASEAEAEASREEVAVRQVESAPSEDAPAPVLWIAPVFDPSGYADEARNFIVHLQAQGVAIAARELGRHSSRFREQLDPQIRELLDGALGREASPGCISVVHFPAYVFERIPQAAYHIGRVMFETDGLPAEWVAKCNQMDEIWVPTDFNLQTFRDAGVTAKLFKVPGGIDTDRFRPGYEPLPIPGARGTVFLSIFEWIYRKGWDVLLRAWAQAFDPDDDVSLVLRTYPVNAVDADAREEIERRIDRFLAEELGLRRGQVAPIIVLGEQVPEEDMPRLFAAATAYVAPSRGEGWGRPHMQAMACGLPVIATRWSGNLEFMNDENSLLIDIEGLVEIDERAEIPFYRGQRWAEPSADHLARLMRQVVSHPEEMARIGQRAREDMVQRWRWEKVAAIAAERLREIQDGLATRGREVGTLEDRPPAVRWEGSQFVHHSLALVNRELCLQLLDAGCELSIIPYEPDQFGPEADPRFHKLAERVNAPLSRPADVHVRHQWPPKLTPPEEGHWVIMQPWEFGSLPKEWVEVMSTQVDEVWTYTSYVRDCYIRSGVPADRVHVVPLGVDVERFRPDVPPFPLQTKKRFKFLFVGGTISRKGIDILLDAYMNAFTAEDDVCLVIKDMGGSSFYKGQTAQDLIAKCRATPNAPEIEYIDRTLSDEELVGLYTACDCLVHPYRGEGFGLPIAEAMACGLPVIVTGHGAALDFCTEETAYLIPARVVRLPQKRVGDLETVDYPWWADPDRDALKQLMRHVVANPEEARAKGRAARDHIREHFTWAHAAEVARKRLQELRDKPIRRLTAEEEQRAAAQQAMGDLLAAGQAALERGDLEAAAREFARVAEQFPDMAAAHTALGSTLVALGRVEEAIPALRRATELVPQAAALQNQLGVALYQLNRLDEAEAAFLRAREEDPEDVEAMLNLIELYRTRGDYARATTVVKEALRTHPNHADVLAAFGILCAELGDGEGVEMALRRVQALSPHHPVVTTLQQVLVTAGENGQGVATP
ncbi:MAG: glycosyltransferase [Chloroflexi bacterium]|nr:glycosyltransferase [Chloroflexota bacterium]